MKILHITAEALRGGCEKNCYLFINESLQYQHDVIVLGKPGPMSTDWSELGISLTHLDILNTGMIGFSRSLSAFLSTRHYDLVICWSTIRLPLQLNSIHRHTRQIRIYLGNPVHRSYLPLKDLFIEFLFPSPKEKVILMACSEYAAQSHRQTRYFNQFEVKVSLNPVLLPVALPQKIKKKESEFLLGMVARLDPIKDHLTVIKGFKLVYEQLSEARLHLVGDGILRKELEAVVGDLGLGHVVYFHGDVKNVYPFLNQWDVFVYATTPSEGLGSVVAEAMSNGKPCVLSDLPMLRELAPVEGLALWFGQRDFQAMARCVIEIYQSSILREQLSQSAYDYAQKHFNAERFVNDYLNERSETNE